MWLALRAFLPGWSTLSGFLQNPFVVAALALGGAWIWHRYDVRQQIRAHDEAATAQRRAEVAEYVVHMSARVAAARAATETVRTEIRTQTRTIVQEVPKYVTPLADSRCVVPRGLVQHLDAAWGLSALPAAPAGLVDEPSGIPLSRVESVTAENAGTAREWRLEALEWRKWYAERKAEHEAFARRIEK